jgi:hypothetical protein
MKVSRSISSLLVRAWRAPMRRKLMLAEALTCTAAAWALVTVMPYTAWRSRLGEAVPLASASLTGASALAAGCPLLEDIAWAHTVLARLFGGRFTCLMLALSARAMLQRRRLPTLLVLGVRRGPEDGSKLGAHAWVLSQGIEIVGGDTRSGHTPVAAYRSLGR